MSWELKLKMNKGTMCIEVLVVWKFGYESVCVVTCRMWVLRLVGWLNSCIRNLFEKLDRL